MLTPRGWLWMEAWSTPGCAPARPSAPTPAGVQCSALYHDFACAGFHPLHSYQTQFQHHLSYEAQTVNYSLSH